MKQTSKNVVCTIFLLSNLLIPSLVGMISCTENMLIKIFEEEFKLNVDSMMTFNLLLQQTDTWPIQKFDISPFITAGQTLYSLEKELLTRSTHGNAEKLKNLYDNICLKVYPQHIRFLVDKLKDMIEKLIHTFVLYNYDHSTKFYLRLYQWLSHIEILQDFTPQDFYIEIPPNAR